MSKSLGNIPYMSMLYLMDCRIVTAEVKEKINKHIARFNLSGEVCAYYSDWEDFCSDWCDYCGYTRTQARKLLHGGIGEFQIIKDYGIIRYVI